MNLKPTRRGGQFTWEPPAVVHESGYGSAETEWESFDNLFLCNYTNLLCSGSAHVLSKTAAQTQQVVMAAPELQNPDILERTLIVPTAEILSVLPNSPGRND